MTTTPSFRQWYAAANRHCIAIAGVGIDDLPDGPSHDAYTSGASPYDYAFERLVEEGYPFDDDDDETEAEAAAHEAEAAAHEARRIADRQLGAERRAVPSNHTLRQALAERRNTGRLPRLY